MRTETGEDENGLVRGRVPLEEEFKGDIGIFLRAARVLDRVLLRSGQQKDPLPVIRVEI